MKSNRGQTRHFKNDSEKRLPESSRSALYAVSQNQRPKQVLLVLPGPKIPLYKNNLVIRTGVQAVTASLTFV